MFGEIKEPKIEKEGGAEDILNESIFREKFPLTYEKIKEYKNFLEEFTSAMKEKMPEKGVEKYFLRISPIFPELYPEGIKEEVAALPKVVNEVDEYAKRGGFKEGALVDPKEVTGASTPPFNFFQIGLRNLIIYQELKSFASLYAKEGLILDIEQQRELLKGKALEIQKEFFTKNEELLRSKKDEKLTNSEKRRKIKRVKKNSFFGKKNSQSPTYRKNKKRRQRYC